MKKLAFEILGEIKTKQRPRATVIGGHARVYTSKDTIYYENYIKTAYQTKYKDFTFQNKPISVHIFCFFKANQEYSKHKDSIFIPCKTHKDLDNIAKTVLDALNGIAFDDDKQITELYLTKNYTLESEKIDVVIEEVSNEYKYVSLNHLKYAEKLNETYDKILLLNAKPKLTKTESAKLKRYEDLTTELANKIESEKRGN